MKYDILHLPGPPIGGCGETVVSPDLGDDHAPGDRVTIRCPHCKRVGTCEVVAALTGLEYEKSG